VSPIDLKESCWSLEIGEILADSKRVGTNSETAAYVREWVAREKASHSTRPRRARQ